MDKHSLAGTYKVSYPMGGEELIIKEDSTFVLETYDCMSDRTEGRWKKKRRHLILNSCLLDKDSAAFRVLVEKSIPRSDSIYIRIVDENNALSSFTQCRIIAGEQNFGCAIDSNGQCK